jgi:hypothetical protein
VTVTETAERTNGVNAEMTPEGAGGTVETTEYLRFVRRILRALSRRVGAADVETLAEMVKLRDELDGRIVEAIAGLRHDATPASWAEIGRALEISRQAAHKRWRQVGGRRRPGGQPGHLR